MSALILLLAIVAHVAAALIAARLAYGRLRAWQVAHPPDRYSCWTVDGRCMQFAIWLTLGCLAGLWPLLIGLAAVMARPPRTPGEMRDRERRDRQRIAELERELGIGP